MCHFPSATASAYSPSGPLVVFNAPGAPALQATIGMPLTPAPPELIVPEMTASRASKLRLPRSSVPSGGRCYRFDDWAYIAGVLRVDRHLVAPVWHLQLEAAICRVDQSLPPDALIAMQRHCHRKWRRTALWQRDHSAHRGVRQRHFEVLFAALRQVVMPEKDELRRLAYKPSLPVMYRLRAARSAPINRVPA